MPDRALGSVEEHEELLRLIEADASTSSVEQYARAHRLRTVRYLQTRIAGSVPEMLAPEILA